jgi:hypothetical protein
MSVGVALVIIFVLYLIDKHNQWRRAALITAVAVVLGILGLGSWFGWIKYQDWKAAKDRGRIEAEQAKRDAQACADWESKHPLGSPIDVLHGKWDDGTPMPKEGVTVGTPQGCSGALEDAYNLKLANSQKHSSGSVDCFDKKSGQKTKDFYAEFGGVTTSCGQNYIQKPAGLCKEIAALSDKSHSPDCVSRTVIDLSAGLVSK